MLQHIAIHIMYSISYREEKLINAIMIHEAKVNKMFLVLLPGHSFWTTLVLIWIFSSWLSHLWLIILYIYVLLKALPPVCMKYTARGESWVANIARGEAECYICHETLTKSCILSYKRSGSALSVLLYFTLKDVLTEGTPLKFNTFIE